MAAGEESRPETMLIYYQASHSLLNQGKSHSWEKKVSWDTLESIPRHKQNKSCTLPIKIEKHTKMQEKQSLKAPTFRKQNTKQTKYLTFQGTTAEMNDPLIFRSVIPLNISPRYHWPMISVLAHPSTGWSRNITRNFSKTWPRFLVGQRHLYTTLLLLFGCRSLDVNTYQ
jgi:hypothetical protein